MQPARQRRDGYASPLIVRQKSLSRQHSGEGGSKVMLPHCEAGCNINVIGQAYQAGLSALHQVESDRLLCALTASSHGLMLADQQIWDAFRRIRQQWSEH